MPQAIEAKFAGACPGCGTRINEGDKIVYDDDADGWVHATKCADGLLDEPSNPLCTSCWIHHAGECD